MSATLRGYLPMRTSAAVLEERNLEEGPVAAGLSDLFFQEPRGVRRCSRRQTAAVVLGGVACALAFGAWSVWHAVPAKGDLPASRGEVEQLWWKDDVYGPCPDPGPRTGGVPRSPLFMTVGQAFDCLDVNKDHVLVAAELPPGAGIADVDYPAFHELVRRDRDEFLKGLPMEANKVREWVELVLKWLPPSQAPVWAKPQAVPEEQVQASAAAPDAPAAPAAAYGEVAELYTFGAPAVVQNGQLRNPARSDGCFPGLRTYTRGSYRHPSLEARFYVSDPFASFLGGMGFSHTKQASMAVNVDNTFHSGYSECEDGWNGPKLDLFFWFDGHRQRLYDRSLHELSGLLGARDYHEPKVETAVTQVEVLKGQASTLCSAHPQCAASFANDTAALCCPDAAGAKRACCAESAASSDRFDVSQPFMVGDMVRVTVNETLLRDALLQVVYAWDDGMKPMLGQVFPVTRLASPGIVGLPSSDGSDGGLWYFPVGTLSKVSPEVAKAMGATTTPQMARLLAEAPHDSKRASIAKAAGVQRLAVLTYDESDSAETKHALDSGYSMIAHVLTTRNATGLTPSAGLFQDVANAECVLSFATRAPVGYQQQPGASGDDFFTKRPILARSLFTWWGLFSGLEPVKYHGQTALWSGGADDHIYTGPMGAKIDNTTGICTYSTPLGVRPCPDNKTLATDFGYKGMTKATFTRDWCGIKDVEIYLADALDYFTQQPEYATGLAAKLPSCSRVQATGHDLGGGLAALWSACANSRLQEGQAGFEEWRRVAWTVKPAGEVLGASIPEDEARQDAGEVYVLRNKKTGKVLEVTGSSIDIHLGRGSLELKDAREAGDLERWQLTPEGLLRNRKTSKCIGVEGQLGSSNPEANQGVSLAAQDCLYGLKSTAQAWNLTAQGLMVNQYAGLCLSTSMTLTICPLSDQLWHLRSDGFMVNQLSGQCLDIQGDPGTALGDQATIWPCEYDREDTDQRWTYTKQGFLKNLRSGRCLDVKQIHGNEAGHTARAILWDCVDTLAAPIAQVWDMDASGFVINRMTGKCLNVDGRHQTKAGALVVTESCTKFVGARSMHLWELGLSGELVNRGSYPRFNGRCVAQTAGGTGLELKSCSANARQHWRVSKEGELKPAMHMDMCLGSAAGSLGVFSCESPNVTAKWYASHDGFLVNRKTGHCVDVDVDGATLREGLCHMTDQTWESSGNGQLKHKLSGRCLDVVGGPKAAQGVAPAGLQLWDCLPSAVGTDQAWDIANGTKMVNLLSGKCMDVEGVASSGVLVVLDRCATERAEQQWESKGGFLKHLASGLCADIQGFAGAAAGAQLSLSECEIGGSWTDQTWKLQRAERASRGGTAGSPALAALRLPAGFRPAFADAAPQTTAIQGKTSEPLAAGEFVSAGQEVYWVYRGYKHLVSSDCSACNCKTRIAAVAPSQLDVLVLGKSYDCNLQSMADVLDGLKARGAEALASEEAAALSGIGRFISAGRNVYWEYDGRKHEVMPGAGCSYCGCENVVLISDQELASTPTGTGFQCEMTGIAQYGAHFMK